MKYCYLTYNEDRLDEDYLYERTKDVDLFCKSEIVDYDFIDGLRMKFHIEEEILLIIKDLDKNIIIFKQNITPEKDLIYICPFRYCINYGVDIVKIRHNQPDVEPWYSIEYNPENKNILCLLGCEEQCGLGDGLAWIQGVELYRKKYPNANVYIVTAFDDLDNLIEDKHKQFHIIKKEQFYDIKFYAIYLHGAFFNNDYYNSNPQDYRLQSLIEMGCNVMNVPFREVEENAVLSFRYETEKPKTHYVCLSLKSSGIFKEWIPKNKGVKKLIDLLNSFNYNVYLIDKEFEHVANELIKTTAPKNAIDMTGNYTLIERAKFISGCDFFIGCSSGLSWLAWTCQVPVVLISGFTHPLTEFYTPYRVQNPYICHSCWNDASLPTYPKQNGCPRKKDIFMGDFLECSTEISYLQVFEAIKKIPEFKEYTHYDI